MSILLILLLRLYEGFYMVLLGLKNPFSRYFLRHWSHAVNSCKLLQFSLVYWRLIRLCLNLKRLFSAFTILSDKILGI